MRTNAWLLGPQIEQICICTWKVIKITHNCTE